MCKCEHVQIHHRSCFFLSFSFARLLSSSLSFLPLVLDSAPPFFSLPLLSLPLLSFPFLSALCLSFSPRFLPSSSPLPSSFPAFLVIYFQIIFTVLGL